MVEPGQLNAKIEKGVETVYINYGYLEKKRPESSINFT
jgi:hypothetical protein